MRNIRQGLLAVRLRRWLRAVALASVVPVPVFGAAWVAVGGRLLQGKALVLATTILVVSSVPWMSVLALLVDTKGWLRRVPAARRVVIALVTSPIPVLAIMVLFRESGYPLLPRTWQGFLETVPWMVAYAAGGLALVTALGLRGKERPSGAAV